ncbi:16S rRNA m(2)G966 methyltransferase [Catenovulum agarivorans DS-2]|uniref:Ribosomal RNA small subunit methyltransferase D n=2 Tax=Catenovulum agarivorans TaxID=1172192 RepID=W7QIB3_9ALTE|nr:16S rRNA m(2)G966 methyltransferase [Catenovulum agarivorans DS-2]
MDIDGLRPTTDRVKETLFNWIMFDVAGANVLDCFAGSGALAFEALSRGANQLTMLELSNSAANQLKQNLASLNVTNDVQCQIITTDSQKYLANPATQQYDLIFIDPPFRKNLLTPCCELLSHNNWLAANAFIYVEHEKELTSFTPPENWQLLKSQSAGQSCYHLYQYQPQ